MFKNKKNKFDLAVLRTLIAFTGISVSTMLCFFLKDAWVLTGGFVGTALIVAQIRESEEEYDLPDAEDYLDRHKDG